MKELTKVMMIEDSESDVLLAKEAFKKNNVSIDLKVYTSANEALTVMNRGDVPDIILLDLNLPGMSGMDFLSRIRKTYGMSIIPVVVLTSSAVETDVVKAYTRGANSYITKPVDAIKFIESMRSLSGFWFESVRLPLNVSESVKPSKTNTSHM